MSDPLNIEEESTDTILSSKRIDAVQWRDDGILAFKFGDGRVTGLPAPEELAFKEMGMSVVEYRPWARKLTFVQNNGMGFTLDVGSSQNWSPIRGRPVIYLDQNQWSTLSKAWYAPQRLRSAEEHAAAVKLLKLAESGQVILPMSAAHLSETGAWTRETDRRALAETILSGSSGWQMRDPLEVRAAELRTALRASAGIEQEPLPDVFTLAPYAALDVSSRGDVARSHREEIPEEWWNAHDALLSHVVYAACLLDQDPTPRGDLSGWLERVEGFASWLRSETERSKERKRRSAYVFMVSDMSKEVAHAAFAAGISPEQMGAWTQRSWHKVWDEAPGMSHFREAMVDKLVDGAKWEVNDLTDLMYLCTAAAYADHVVGERRTIALLRQASKRLGSPVHLHTDLVSLEESLNLTTS